MRTKREIGTGLAPDDFILRRGFSSIAAAPAQLPD
jgi:hypothetical protein